MFKVESDSPLTAWGQVERDLRRRIADEEFPAGSRLPSEHELLDYYGVSRSTVRRAISELVSEGYLERRHGVGSFVLDRNDFVHVEIDLLRPWREQLLATGNVARSRLLNYQERADVPESLRSLLRFDPTDRLSFGLHVQEVNGVTIAITESWIPVDGEAIVISKPRGAFVHGTSHIKIVSANRAQSQILNTYRDAPLLEITTYSRLRDTGELVELARTSWLANRVHCTYSRILRLGQIDMSELLAMPSAD